MKATASKTLWLAIGCVFLVLGVIGAILPILQGWIFFLIALAIFAEQSEMVRGWIKSARRRWPKFSHKVNQAAQHRRAPRAVQEFARSTDPGV